MRVHDANLDGLGLGFGRGVCVCVTRHVVPRPSESGPFPFTTQRVASLGQGVVHFRLELSARAGREV